MATATQKKLHAFHLSLYEKAFQDAHSYATLGSPSILSYKEKFVACLPNDPRVTDLSEIVGAAHQGTFLLYGDFHTLRQAQGGLLQLLDAYAEEHPQRPVILALEMFKAIDQPAIDAFMAARISEEELLQAVSYAQDWGFPWGHYRELLVFARTHGFKILGINSDMGGKDDLRFRDQFAAKLLTAAATAQPEALIVCQIGEYHLADQHLPACLASEAGDSRLVVRVFSNIERYYFSVSLHREHHAAEYLFLKPNMFCILNVSPWLKWQSHAFWEEQRQAETADAFDDDGALYTEESLDVDYHVLALATNLASFLDLQLPKSELTRFNIFMNPDRQTLAEIGQRYVIPDEEMLAYAERARLDGYGFIPKGMTIILTEPSLNNFAEATGRLLYHLARRARPALENREDVLFRRIEEAAAGMVATKILNPRRKSRDLDYFTSYLRTTKKKRLVAAEQVERATARGVVRFHEWLGERANGARFPRSLISEDNASHHELSHALGQMLGASLFHATMAGGHAVDPVRTLFTGGQAPELFATVPQGAQTRRVLTSVRTK